MKALTTALAMAMIALTTRSAFATQLTMALVAVHLCFIFRDNAVAASALGTLTSIQWLGRSQAPQHLLFFPSYHMLMFFPHIDVWGFCF